MSQTTGNYVGIGEEPGEMYGKILSIPDNLLYEYFYQLTNVVVENVPPMIKDAPRDAKRALAREIVSIYHDKDAAVAAQEEFDRVHIQHERPSEVPQVQIDRALIKEGGTIWIVDLLQASNLAKSRGEAKRLIAQGGVKINDERISSADLDLPFEPPILIQVGKRSFAEAV